MTPRQIELARHALGLPNKQKRTYRNYFVAGDGHVDFEDWQAMVNGCSAIRRGPFDTFGGDYIFHLTRRGADAALREGERLCPEDWIV